MSRVNAWTVTGALAIIAACTGPGGVHLLEEDWSSESRLRRMNLIVESYDGTEWHTGEKPVSDIVNPVLDHCAWVVREADGFGACGSFDNEQTCSGLGCRAHLRLCAALTFREMAEGVSTVELRLGYASPPLAVGEVKYRIRPQDVESRVALWQTSQLFATAVFSELTSMLSFCSGTDLEDGFPPEAPVLSQSTGELWASTLVEALAVGELAAEAGARGALGIADRDRAAISSLGAAARVSWFDENLSRLIAVQSHVGGLDQSAWEPPSLRFRAGAYVPDDHSTYFRHSIVDTGIGAQPPCTGACATALETLRFSGAPFSAILAAGTSLDDLIANHVGPRLQARSPGVYGTSDAQALADSLRIPRSALLEARAWMRHEAEVFARPTGVVGPTPTLPPHPDGAPSTTTLTFDATTMARPTAPPSMHYLRLSTTYQSRMADDLGAADRVEV